RQVLARKPDPRIVAVDGGLAGFAELIGEKGSKSASDRVHNVLDAGQAFHSKWPGGEIAGLWTYGIRPHAPGRRAEMQVVLGVPLLPHYTRGDFLVPIVSLPGFVGRENEWAAQASLQFLVTAALVEHREELVTEGGANLS